MNTTVVVVVIATISPSLHFLNQENKSSRDMSPYD